MSILYFDFDLCLSRYALSADGRARGRAREGAAGARGGGRGVRVSGER